jgi:diguanylate cyclase (GGDEF)-like protein
MSKDGNKILQWSKLETFAEVIASRAIDDLGSQIAVFGKRGPAWTYAGGSPSASSSAPPTATECVEGGGIMWDGPTLIIRIPGFEDAIAVARPVAVLGDAEKADFQRQLSELLERHIAQSADRHAAMTDHLTALPNRAAFDTRLTVAITSWAAFRGAQLAQGEPPQGVWVVLYDLDKFKQANDTFGHEYGDLLLQSFAWEFAAAFRGQLELYPLADKCCFARFGGEEFALLITGTLLDAEVNGIANSVRKQIDDARIPNREHWDLLRQLHGPEIEAHHRLDQPSVTASAGWAGVYDLPDGMTDLSRVAQLLKSRADVALYSAKEYGRNQTRGYRSVRRAFGKVIEHNTVPNIVAIDIGSSAGVAKGDVFEVFDGKFIGDQTFTIRGLRSEKTLGLYPKMTSGRVRVRGPDQREVSFCTPLSDDSPGPFAAKSRLFLFDEITKTYACQLDQLSMREAEASIEEQLALGRRIVVVVFRIEGMNHQRLDYHNAIADRLLNGLTDGIVNEVDGVLLRTEVSANEAGLVFVGQSIESIKSASLPLIDQITAPPTSTELLIGLFDSERSLDTQRPKTQFSAKSGLRYAAAAARSSKEAKNWRNFTDSGLTELLEATIASAGLGAAMELASAFWEDGVTDRGIDVALGRAAIQAPAIRVVDRDAFAEVAGRLGSEERSIDSLRLSGLLTSRIYGYLTARDTFEKLIALGEQPPDIHAALLLADIEKFRELIADSELNTVSGQPDIQQQATALAARIKEFEHAQALGPIVRTDLANAAEQFKNIGVRLDAGTTDGASG